MALDSNMNSATFNCYCSLDYANTYVDNRLHTDLWDAASTEDREAALIWASKLLDSSFVWSGARVNTEQNMAFPRYGLYDAEGYYVKSDIIPEQVKDATVEQAMLLLAKDRTGNSEPSSQGLSSLKLGSMSLDFDKTDKAQVVSDYVATLLYGLYRRTRGGSSVVDVVRT